MAIKNTANSNTKSRLLLNAEPFGFGPSAAIADFFPYLRNKFSTIGYIGKGHTLDLQRGLSYDAIHDLSALSADEESKATNEILANYDIFLTAMDFNMAQSAKETGLVTCIYDALTWYWKQMPEATNNCDLYIAQDFLGVNEILTKNKQSFSRPYRIVSPIVPADLSNDRAEYRAEDHTGQLVLLNVGGLSNPYWNEDDTLAYARLIVTSFQHVILSANPQARLVIAANSKIAQALKSCGVKNYSRNEMQNILRQSSYALMTPGLGNIYDAACYSIPTIWLPPANDSQGMQLDLLKEHQLCDGALDWSDFANNINCTTTINYRSNQNDVLQLIKELIHEVAKNSNAQEKLAKELSNQCSKVSAQKTGMCTELIKRFGSSGAKQVADHIFELSKEFRR